MEDLNKSPEQQAASDSGVDSLAQMPSFEERQARQEEYQRGFEEARRNGTLPEGVSDAYEYREYMEETTAHAAEASERNKEFLSEIGLEQIKDSYDRNLALSCLPFFLYDDGSLRQDDSRTAVFILAMDFIHRDDKSVTLEDFCDTKAKELSEQDKVLSSSSFGVLKKLERCSRMQKATDAENPNTEVIDYCEDNDLQFHVTGSNFDSFRSKIEDVGYLSDGINSFESRPSSDKGIISVMAKEMIRDHQNAKTDAEKYRIASELGVLANLYRGKGFSVQMQEAMGRAYDAYSDAIYFAAQKGDDVIRSGAQISITDISRAMSIHSVSGEFNRMRRNYERYQQLVEKGRFILQSIM